MKISAFLLLLITTIVSAQVPQSRHVWVVTEENHSYERVIGNSSMPYFNGLAKKYGLAAQYYAEQHNSISALMWLVAGKPITGNNSTTTCYSADNIVRHLLLRGFTWQSYQEDLPYAGFTGISHLNYVRRHNPIIDFTDSCAPSEAVNSVPYSQFAKEAANHTTPNYAYISPNLQHDAHDGPPSAADSWLSQNVPTILALPEFQPGGDGILFIVWDEGDLSGNGVPQDNRCSSTISSGCGGRVATLVIGPQVKVHHQSSVLYHHANLLRTVCDAMGFSSCPAGGASAKAMSDMFDSVNISAPLPNAVAASPIGIQAAASINVPVNATQIYVDHVLKYQVSGPAVNTQLSMKPGQHYIVVKAWDCAGGIHARSLYVTVR